MFKDSIWFEKKLRPGWGKVFMTCYLPWLTYYLENLITEYILFHLGFSIFYGFPLPLLPTLHLPISTFAVE